MWLTKSLQAILGHLDLLQTAAVSLTDSSDTNLGFQLYLASYSLISTTASTAIITHHAANVIHPL